MKIIKTTERFDGQGNLIERLVETMETAEAYQYMPYTTYPYPQPYTITYTSPLTDLTPTVTWTTQG